MDRNTLIGMLLIGAVLVGYNILTLPSAEEIAQQRYEDSLRQVQVDSARAASEDAKQAQINPDSQTSVVEVDSQMAALPDSVREARLDSIQEVTAKQEYGRFSQSRLQASSDDATEYTIENENIRATISSQGGRMIQVELKQYQTWDTLPLYLFTEDSSAFGFSFYDNNRLIVTDSLHFDALGESVSVIEGDSSTISFRAYGSNKNEYIEYTYGLSGESHLLDFEVKVVGIDGVIRGQENDNKLDFRWFIMAPSKEKGIKSERMASTIYFKLKEEGVDYVGIGGSSREEIDLLAAPEWISFKQQFFSAAIIPLEGGATKNQAKVETTPSTGIDYTMEMGMGFQVDMGDDADPRFHSQFYFGPNHFQTLSALGYGLEDQIDLGWGIFGWVNQYMVIPIFNLLDGFGIFNYGIIILLLTIFIKLILFPLTYRNYKSSAKMRVLKPEIDEITAKFKDGDAMKKQQATMALYRSAGVNPMAGCIPMLLQMPILYAMFRFFPASIELRQQSFLWATDLSTYDSIFEFGYIPFIGDIYGQHVSLFTLLMATSTFFYTRYNMQLTGSSNQLPQMKYIMYFMPVMLLMFFNGYSSGLSYYYFTANVISIAQQLIIKKWFINEDAIRAKIQANKARPPKKKSRFQQRMEDMQKAQQEQRGKRSGGGGNNRRKKR